MALWIIPFNGNLLQSQIELLERQSLVKSEVQDFLSTTEAGKSVAAPKRLERCLPWKRRVMEVTSRSVFASTRWVCRHITQRELMLMYNIGVMHAEQMIRVWSVDHGQYVSDFTQQVPMRVLLRGLECLSYLRGYMVLKCVRNSSSFK